MPAREAFASIDRAKKELEARIGKDHKTECVHVTAGFDGTCQRIIVDIVRFSSK